MIQFYLNKMYMIGFIQVVHPTDRYHLHRTTKNQETEL